MTGLIGRLLPRRIAGQIAVLVIAAIVVAQTIFFAAFLILRREPSVDGRPGAAADRLASLVRLIEAAQADRGTVVAVAARTFPALGLDSSVTPRPKPDETRSGDERDHPEVADLRRMLGAQYAVTQTGSTETEQRVSIRLPDGSGLGATLSGSSPRAPPIAGAILIPLVFLAIALGLLSVWAARALAAPLARLADAAERFGTGAEPAALPRHGPEEVLAASRALGRMRDRVQRLLDDRSQMLAAVSHDLRTPITRLRLRAEFVEDEAMRASTLRDLDQMNGMVEAALSFVRDGRTGAGMVLVDLAPLVSTICDAFADAGGDVRYEGPDHLVAEARADDLERAIGNLVDNAVKYGGRVVVRLLPGAHHDVAIAVEDEGPGIPDGDRETVLEPFVRGDRARNLDAASGFGLGLSIARAIAEAHGGRLTLANREPSGFVARLDLPVVRPAAKGRPASQ